MSKTTKQTIRISSEWNTATNGRVSDAWWDAANAAPPATDEIRTIVATLSSVDEATVSGPAAARFFAWAEQFPGFQDAFGK